MIVSANSLADGDVQSFDVVVIGSGCGGAVVAAECAQAGKKVVVLEEGRHFKREEYARFAPSDALRYMYRDYGAMPVVGLGDTPTILLIVGMAVGGSSIVNGAVCGRPPEWVLERWAKEFGLADFGPKALEPYFDAMEKEMGVAETAESLIPPSAKLFQQAAGRLGYQAYRIKRNVEGCDGCCRCVFTCPHDHKKSVVITHLDVARSKGAVVVSDCHARRLVREGSRVTGVKAWSADGKVRITFMGRKVVLAAGAIHAPLFLKKNGLGRVSSHVGEHLTVHPSYRTYALFDQPVYPNRGAFQNMAVDQFRNEGIRLVNVGVPKGILASSLPRKGAAHRALAEKFDHIGVFGGLVSDKSEGRVRTSVGWRPLITYRMLPEDRARFLRGLDLLCQVWFEAGARRVFLPFHEVSATEAGSLDEARKILQSNISMRLAESTAQHPLGTCRMGADPRASVVGPDGAMHGVPGLYIADGSVVPSSVAVNPQVTIMAMCKRLGQRIAEG